MRSLSCTVSPWPSIAPLVCPIHGCSSYVSGSIQQGFVSLHHRTHPSCTPSTNQTCICWTVLDMVSILPVARFQEVNRAIIIAWHNLFTILARMWLRYWIDVGRWEVIQWVGQLSASPKANCAFMRARHKSVYHLVRMQLSYWIAVGLLEEVIQWVGHYAASQRQMCLIIKPDTICLPSGENATWCYPIMVALQRWIQWVGYLLHPKGKFVVIKSLTQSVYHLARMQQMLPDTVALREGDPWLWPLTASPRQIVLS